MDRGKATLALSFLGPKADAKHPAYLNWDHGPSSEKIRKTELPPKHKLLVFDELHKFKLWKRWITIGPVVHYFAQRTDIPVFYQVHRGTKHFESGKIVVIPFEKFCQELACRETSEEVIDGLTLISGAG